MPKPSKAKPPKKWRGKALDDFHWHEATDRASLMVDIFEMSLSDHPVVKRTPELRRAASEVMEKLVAFYTAFAVSLPLVKLGMRSLDAWPAKRKKVRR